MVTSKTHTKQHTPKHKQHKADDTEKRSLTSMSLVDGYQFSVSWVTQKERTFNKP